MIWWVAVAIPAVTLGCATGGGLRAQAAGADLSRLEAAIDEGRLEGARVELDRWLADADGASAEDVGRARYLRARLIADTDSAQREYLAVALDGRSSYGARSWLRIAQLHLARDEAATAIEALERLRADYPRGDVTPASWYWTARAEEARGGLEEACSAFDRAITEAGAAGDALIAEQAASRAAVCPSGGLRFTIQVGAFSGRSAAEALAKAVTDLGFPARIVKSDNLEKVRVGRFGSPEAARSLERRLRAEGFSVAVVAGES